MGLREPFADMMGFTGVDGSGVGPQSFWCTRGSFGLEKCFDGQTGLVWIWEYFLIPHG